MNVIDNTTSMLQLAVMISETLEAAGIPAILSGGGAVSQYSNNEYQSSDLDFVTVEANKVIAPIIATLGFYPRGKDFYHPNTDFLVEFPPGPLAFGDEYVSIEDATRLSTQYGTLRIITPTQCVMDRLCWFIHGHDKQALDQAVLVARKQEIDWKKLKSWARSEGMRKEDFDGFLRDAGNG